MLCVQYMNSRSIDHQMPLVRAISRDRSVYNDLCNSSDVRMYSSVYGACGEVYNVLITAIVSACWCIFIQTLECG